MKVEIEDRELQVLRRDAESYTNTMRWIALAVKIAVGITALAIGITLLFGWVGPKLNLYRANTEKQAVIAEQRAQSEAAEFAAQSRVTQAKAEAQAEIERAKGLAQAQQIISETLTDEYLRYLYIQALVGNPNQIIYVPTEAGLPILEAGRAIPGAEQP